MGTTEQLRRLKVGHTTLVDGVAVTRWTEEAFEVVTWGRKTVDLKEAVRLVRIFSK